MTRLSPAIRLAILLALAVLGVSGCYAEGTGVSGLRVKRRLPTFDGGLPAIVDAGTGPTRDGGATTCPPADTLEHVPALSAAMSAQAAQSGTMFVGDLFNRFKSNCGGCHVDGNQGDPPFHVSPVTFSDDMAQEDVLSRIFNDDKTKVMPPGVGPAAERNASTDGALQLGALLKAWYKQGRPKNIFVPDATSAGGADGGTGVSWVLASNVGNTLTNIGNCIPSKDVVGVVPDAMDDFFAAATDLPQRLEQTDLTTFDSEVLAEHGVIAYAPAYPLWSDDARKIRYVRVPRGQSIQFDEVKQQFVIPDHTRFYKTFLRKVIERDGTEHYRKIETRLIVANSTSNDWLFGTYQWDPNDETKGAVLDNEPQRDYSAFKDRLITYIADEGRYEALASAEAGAGGDDLTRTLVKAGAIRHYAIPGRDRCVQCHMGSPSRSFVLGFTPLQINRRPLGVGGILEPPGPDELTQLQRLIDYGVITGIKDPTDPTEVLPLEKSEGTRAPRNDYELAAQAYMIGNCAHCHNPNGYPSVQNPVLATTLSFLPGPGPIDGIFQFPLEKFSPRITRDLGGAVQLPYITPSLVDYPGQADYNHTVDHTSTSTIPAPAKGMVLAPWRSLLYRAVDTPFPYSVDLALFPHMPMNVPGFDCRITQIMGDWMVSIPAVRKHPEIDETLVQGFQPTLQPPLFTLHDNTGTDTEFQPYTEVLPPDPSKPDAKQQADYDAAKKAADDRLNAYHKAGADGLSQSKNDWSRYNYCPDTSDTVDPTVTGADRAHLVPSDLKIYESGDQTYNVPVDYQPLKTGGLYDENLVHVPTTATIMWPDEGVPDRPHWVTTDTTDNPPPWVPRRDDWSKILHDHKYTTEDSDQERKVVEMLSPSTAGAGIRLTQNVLDYVGHEIPFGLWKANDACAAKLASQKKVSDFTGAARPKWMDVAKAQPGDPVYTELPGAAVFNMVCVNCHGPQADSHGRQADTLQLMTGGDARVANLRDGFFGPTTSPGANRKAVFDITPSDANAPTADDWAARYLPWMALGGTQKLIPRAILNVVATTPVLGIARNLQGVDSANMLGPVQTLCAELFRKSTWNVLPGTETTTVFDFHVGNPPQAGAWGNWLWTSTVDSAQGRLIGQNGDAELWPKLCGLNNSMPVAAIRMEGGLSSGAFRLDDFDVTFYDSGSYPADQPIGNDHGAVDVGILATNTQPWCVVRPEDSGDIAETYTQIDSYQTSDGKPLPLCPSSFVAGFDQQSNQLTYDRLTQWSYRGAVNAGLAVFVYLDKIAKGYKPVPSYDQCQSLP